MKKRITLLVAIVVPLIILLICIVAIIFPMLNYPEIGSVKENDPQKYGSYNKATEDIIEDFSIGVLPSSELVKDICETYEYEYSCGILGYPSCYVYLSAVFTEDDMFVAEINRIKDGSLGQAESNNKKIYTFRDDLENAIGFYSDDKIEDGRTHIFSFAIVDEKEKSIEYFFAYQQESAGENERISTVLKKALQIQ